MILDGSSIFICSMYLNSPPQADVGNHHKLGFEKQELGRGDAFGEDVSHMVRGLDEFNQNIMINHLFTNKMVINFDVLCTSMKHKIRS